MTKCLIIGSGIIGLTTAYELSKAGHKVTIIYNDKNGQASKSAAGLLFPLNPWNNSKNMQKLCMAGHQEYNNFFNILNNKEKNEIGFEKKNLIIFGENIDLAKNWYQKNYNFKFNYTKKKLNTIERNIKEFHKNFLEIENINVINPQKLLNYLKHILIKKNVEFKKYNIEKLNIFLGMPENDKYDFIIICAGAWSNYILEKKDMYLKPIKGQLLYFKTEEKLIHNVLLYKDYYIIPRNNNNIVVGATIEDVGFDEKITEKSKTYLANSITEIFEKKIKMINFQQKFGFRPYIDTEEPCIIADDANKRLIYNFGHYRYCVLTAISSAKKVLDLIS